MTLAHVAGVPLEEWLAPLAVTGSGLALVVRAAFRLLQQRS
jgi:hypothetical protein